MRFKARIEERVTKDVEVEATTREEAERLFNQGEYTLVEEVNTECANIIFDGEE